MRKALNLSAKLIAKLAQRVAGPGIQFARLQLWRHRESPEAAVTNLVRYRCNICDSTCMSRLAQLSREERSCWRCGSTVRMRAIIHLLSMELFGQSLTITEFPTRPDIKGIGLSDWDGYAVRLACKLGYTNTYYHQQPMLDITCVDPALAGTMDFVIASDVFEHVAPPVSMAFDNVRRLLKPNGVLILTVPYTLERQTREHFPELYRFEVMQERGRYLLRNTTKDGEAQVFDNLVFHGGPGSTLEMRVFCEAVLLDHLKKSGFAQIKVHRQPCFGFGVVWLQDWSLPITARGTQFAGVG